MHTQIHTYTYIRIHTYYIHTIHACMHACIHTYVHTYMHNIHTHTHASTHTPSLSFSLSFPLSVSLTLSLTHITVHGMVERAECGPVGWGGHRALVPHRLSALEIYYIVLYMKPLKDLLHEPWYQIVSAPKEIYYVKPLEDLLHEPWPGTRSSQRLEGFM